MLPWRNYFTISLIMAVVVAFCASLVLTREKLNNYDENDFAVSYDGGYSSESAWKAENTAGFSEPGRIVLYLGDIDNDSFGGTAGQWCLYSKRALKAGTELGSLMEHAGNAEVLLVNPDYLSNGDVSLLKEISDKGTAMVFMKMPARQRTAGSETLKSLMGISSVENDICRLDGVRLFSGFLLGGEGEYIAESEKDAYRQDMRLDVERYHIGAGTKVYMRGVLKSETDNEDMPPLIWRSSAGNSFVFTVNGDYLDDISGIGILEAMMYELHGCELYPVVNSQLVTILSGPDMSSENNAEMERLYGRNLDQTYRELVLPSIASMSSMLNFPMNGMIMLKGDSEEPGLPEMKTLIYYLKWFNEYRSEVGISLVKKEREAVSDILDEYDSFWADNNISYQIKGLCADNEQLSDIKQMLGNDDSNGILSGINTVICCENEDYPLLGYISKNTTMQTVTNDGYRHNFSDDLRLKCFETALGYSNVSADMFYVTFPDIKSDHWGILSNLLTSNVNTYWKPFECFDKNTISESDKRVRDFLKLDYSFKKNGNTISVETRNTDDSAWFILRTHGEKVGKITGGSRKRIEDNAYLIEITEEKAEISIEPEDKLFYYDTK